MRTPRSENDSTLGKDKTHIAHMIPHKSGGFELIPSSELIPRIRAL